MQLSDYDRGWLVGIIEADASVYSEGRTSGARRLVIDTEVANRELAERLASALGACAPTTRDPSRKHDAVNWQRPTYRVRLRGPRAAALLTALLPAFTPETAARVRLALASTAPLSDTPAPVADTPPPA